MAKFYGQIGFAETTETKPGIWTEVITERNYYGDMIKNMNRVRADGDLNAEITVDNKLSIIADPFAYSHFQSMRYIKWMGACWKINSVDIQRPRLLLTIGGVYNKQPT